LIKSKEKKRKRMKKRNRKMKIINGQKRRLALNTS
jgi:hypothetical protein